MRERRYREEVFREERADRGKEGGDRDGGSPLLD